MTSGGGIVQTITSNWLNILVTFVATGITLYSSRRYRTNARKERLAQAEDSVIEVVEEHVIDNKEFSVKKFDNIISAAGRENDVPLSDNVSKVSLLEDLELKIEKSNHLNTEQKEEYTDQIEGYIEEAINESKEVKINDNSSELLEQLSGAIENGEKEEAQEYLDQLQYRIGELEKKNTQQEYLSQKFDLISTTIFGIVVFLSYFYILNRFDDLFRFDLSSLFIYVILAMIIAFTVMTFKWMSYK